MKTLRTKTMLAFAALLALGALSSCGSLSTWFGIGTELAPGLDMYYGDNLYSPPPSYGGYFPGGASWSFPGGPAPARFPIINPGRH